MPSLSWLLDLQFEALGYSEFAVVLIGRCFVNLEITYKSHDRHVVFSCMSSALTFSLTASQPSKPWRYPEIASDCPVLSGLAPSSDPHLPTRGYVTSCQRQRLLETHCSSLFLRFSPWCLHCPCCSHTVFVLRIPPPCQVVAGPIDHNHQQHLKLNPGFSAHVRLPWLGCQKQPPAEAQLLLDVKLLYRSNAAVTAGAPSSTSAPPPPPPKTPSTAVAGAATKAPKPAVATTTTTSHVAPAPPASSRASVTQGVATEELGGPMGPLLLFPDTSALLSMLGGNVVGGGVASGAASMMDVLGQLAGKGRFGRDLLPSQQTYIVIADSVMKQVCIGPLQDRFSLQIPMGLHST